MSTVATVDGQGLVEAIADAIDSGLRMSIENVLAIWNLAEALPGIQTRRIWLEIGYQMFANGFPSTGEDFLHILGKHSPQFAAKGVDQGEIFSTLSDALMEKTPLEVKLGFPASAIYLMESESDKFLMVIALGSNGFIVTAYPRRIKNNPKDDASLSSKRARKADDTVRSLDAIQEIETPVAVLSSNIDDPMMIKDHGGALEYVSATDVVANNLASRVNAYGYQNRIRALSNGILNAKDEFIAMTIALEIRLTTGLETFLEIDGSFVSITRDYVESKLDNVLDTELERYPRLDTTDLSSPLK